MTAMAVKSEPNIVLFDLETLPIMDEVMKVFPGLGNYEGLTLKASINSIICFGYKEYPDGQVKCKSVWDFPGWEKDINNDKKLVEFIIEKLIDADAVVTHNGKKFDWRFLQTRILYHGLTPLPKIPHIDTCQEAKKNLYFFNNKLDTISKFLFDDKKLGHEGWYLWVKVSQGNKKAMKLMSEYCKKDVILLEKAFKKLRPLISGIPNYNLYKNFDKDVCPSCGSTRFIGNGTRANKTTMFKRYRCLDCGSNFSWPKNKIPRSL